MLAGSELLEIQFGATIHTRCLEKAREYDHEMSCNLSRRLMATCHMILQELQSSLKSMQRIDVSKAAKAAEAVEILCQRLESIPGSVPDTQHTEPAIVLLLLICFKFLGHKKMNKEKIKEVFIYVTRGCKLRHCGRYYIPGMPQATFLNTTKDGTIIEASCESWYYIKRAYYQRKDARDKRIEANTMLCQPELIKAVKKLNDKLKEMRDNEDIEISPLDRLKVPGSMMVLNSSGDSKKLRYWCASRFSSEKGVAKKPQEENMPSWAPENCAEYSGYLARCAMDSGVGDKSALPCCYAPFS